MSDEPLPSGWLPPKAPEIPKPAEPAERPEPPGWAAPHAPVHYTGTAGPPRPPGAWPRDPARPVEPSSPAAVLAIALSSAGILVLVITAGAAFPLALMLSGYGLLRGMQVQRRIQAGAPGRPSQARAAVIVGGIGFGLAIVGCIVWLVLAANGITPRDLNEALQRELERQRGGG